jgi:uncharacterized membrane protein
MIRVLLASLALVTAIWLCRETAEANVHFCNATPAPISFAIAGHGWYTVAPGACVTPLNNTDASTTPVYYYYADAAQDTTWLNDATQYGIYHHLNTGRTDTTIVFLAPDASLGF